MRGAHDCFGSILVVEGGEVKILCDECGRPSAVVNTQGFHHMSPHGSKKHHHRIKLRALKLAIEHVEKWAGRSPDAGQ